MFGDNDGDRSWPSVYPFPRSTNEVDGSDLLRKKRNGF